MSKSNSSWNRRQLLRLAGSGALAPYLLPFGCRKDNKAKAEAERNQASLDLVNGKPRKFLFVFTALGGASINDSFLAVRDSECKNSATMNSYADDLVFEAKGTGLRAVDFAIDEIGPLPFSVQGNQSAFLGKYANDIMVATMSGTTVAHPIGQFRCLDGNEAWNGRTLQEAVAMEYGADLLMPNVNMATVGFAEHGKDPTVPEFARALSVPDPIFFPFAMHGHAGIPGAPEAKLLEIARRTRDTKLDPTTAFFRRFGKSDLVQQFMWMRGKTAQLEKMDLINKFINFENSDAFPFNNYDLKPNPRGEYFRKIFPKLAPDTLKKLPDKLSNQALLAYLLVTTGVSCTVTFGIDMNLTVDNWAAVDSDDDDDIQLTGTPTGFDYSHNGHRGTQALLWQRTLDTIDRLITLLKATEYENGESYWDHSMIYIATEFGRDKLFAKKDKEDDFPSGHDTNNAVTVISPFANGGQVLGGVDKDSLLTYGFDPQTGKPDLNRNMKEKEIYAGILQAMGVDTKGSNLPEMPAMRRKA